MSIALLFIKRPVMTTLVMLAILIAGTMAYFQLPVSDLPTVDYPTIQVSAGLPGASAETMAASVATPLERQFSTIAGLDSMTSSNSKGSTQITLQFALSRELDAAAQDVQSAIATAQRRLPDSMPSPPSYRKVNPADSPVLFLALSSRLLPLSAVDEYAETFMAQRISMINGVAQVQIFGAQKYAVRVQLDPKALAAHSIGIDEVENAINNGNVNLPTGNLEGEHRAYTIETDGQLQNAAQYRPLIVAYRNGAPVRLDQLGKVIDSVENLYTASWYNDTRAIVLAIQRQPGTNTIEVVDEINKLLPSFRAQIPPAIEINTLFDRTDSIRASVADVKFTLILTVGLVVLVIFAFLRNISATLIPSLALPMSLIGSCALMYLFGYSIDNLSLMALTLCVGFVVDDAIVMLENIHRHQEMGKPPMQAAVDGSGEIGFTILSMTLSLAAVFIPVFFMEGLIGRLLHEFAVTIIVAILISGFISLSLTPMLCSRFLRPPREIEHGFLFNFTERIFNAMLAAYDATLKIALKLRPLMVLIFVALLFGTGWLFMHVPNGFLPSDDTGQISVTTEADQGTSYAAMVDLQKRLAQIALSNPAVDAMMSSVQGDNAGRMFMRLKPRADRKVSADELIQQLRGPMASVAGVRAYLQNPPPIRIGGRLSKALYQFTLQSPDTGDLFHYADILQQKMQDIPGLQDVTSDMQNQNPQVNMDIMRDKASSLGLSARQVEDAMFSAYGSRQISSFYTPTDTYNVYMELAPEYQSDPNLLSELYVRTANGMLAPLSTFVTLHREVGPLTITHLGQLPSVTISFNLAPGVSLGDAVKRVDALAAQVLPASVTTSFQGTAQAFQSSLQGLGLLLLMAVLVIYLVLGILYESFIHPITILTGLPPAGFGALGALYLLGMELNLYSFVGIIMLVGIVKKNAIMMIDFALEEQKRSGATAAEAIYKGCIVRFRPIMMTTMAALMGALPIALGVGASSESRRPLGVAIVGGLIFSQFLTLYITPVFFIYLEKLHRRRGAQSPVAAQEPQPASAAGA